MRKFWVAGWFVMACCMAACGGAQQHGQLTRMSAAEGAVALCSHEVPEAVCVRCHPELAAKFKEAGD